MRPPRAAGGSWRNKRPKGTSNNAGFRRVIGYQCGLIAIFECDVPPARLPYVRPSPLSKRFERTPPSCGGDPLQRHKAANVVGQVLQANLGARPHDADRAHDPTTRRGLLSSEHMFDASANFTPVAVCFRLRVRQRVVASGARPAMRVAYPFFLADLRKLGFVEGRTLLVEFRPVEESVPRAFAAANELVAWKADVLFAFGTELALQAAAAARPPVPIVMGAANFDPIAKGFVQSLARPGGNVTGIILRWL